MLSEKRKSTLAMMLVMGSIAAFFYKTVFLGKPLAKLGLLPSLDAMFNPSLRKAIIEFKDPSGYLIFFPNGFFEESMWSRLVIPMWNPLVGCGYPLFGDPQSFLFSPAHLLGLFSSPDMYNLGLVLEIALGGAGMVVLSRFLKLSLPASVLASLAFALTPRVLAQVDIGGNECFCPWIFLAFFWLAAKPGLLRAALAGLAASLLAFSAHPETVFFEVFFSAMLSFFTMAIADTNSTDSRLTLLAKIARASARALGLLMVSAVVSVTVASPLLLPFAEFLRHATLYKESAGDGSSGSNLKEYMQGFYFGFGREPFFLGSITALLFPLGAFAPYKRALPLMLCALFGFIICVPQGFVLDFISQKPISYVNTIYAIPPLLLVLSLLAGMGLDALSEKHSKKKTLAFFIVLFLSLILCAAYPIYEQERQMASHDLALLWKNARNALTATSIFATIAAVLCILLVKAQKFRTIAIMVLVSLNFASLAMMCRNILPVNPKFDFTAPAPLAYLRDQNARTVCTGTNFLLPNSNADFGLQDIRCFSPLLPTRYMRFIRACNAQVYNLYFYAFPDNCSRLLDLASVKYICTRNGIKGYDDLMDPALKLDAPTGMRILPGLRISESSYYFDSENSQLDIHLKWKVHDNCNNRYSTQFVVLDKSGKELWSSKEFISAPADSKGHYRDDNTSIPIAQNAELPARLCLRVTDTWISQAIEPDAMCKSIKHLFLLCELPKVKAQSKIPKHFRLAREFTANSCRIYENQKALPPAYLIFNAKHHKRNDEGLLKELDAEGFNPQSTVLLEDSTSEAEANAKNQTEETSPRRLQPLELKRIDCNTLLITCEAPEDAYLVQTDNFYPGWKCFVDGKNTEIIQANYLFRAIRLGKGKHEIRFAFMPTGFFGSICVSLTLIAAIATLAFVNRRKLFTSDNESSAHLASESSMTNSPNQKDTDSAQTAQTPQIE